MSKFKIPEEILAAASGLLAKYGVDLKALLLSAQASKEQEQEKKYLTMNEVEERYGIARWSLYRRIKSGLIKASKLAQTRGGKVLVEKASLEAYLASVSA